MSNCRRSGSPTNRSVRRRWFSDCNERDGAGYRPFVEMGQPPLYARNVPNVTRCCVPSPRGHSVRTERDQHRCQDTTWLPERPRDLCLVTTEKPLTWHNLPVLGSPGNSARPVFVPAIILCLSAGSLGRQGRCWRRAAKAPSVFLTHDERRVSFSFAGTKAGNTHRTTPPEEA